MDQSAEQRMEDGSAEKPAAANDAPIFGKYLWEGDKIANTRAPTDTLGGQKITDYSWDGEGKKVSIYVELPNLDKMAEEGANIESDSRSFTLTLAVPTADGNTTRTRVLKIEKLAHDIDGAKLIRKPGKDRVVVKLNKKTPETKWWDLTSKDSGGDDDDQPFNDNNGDEDMNDILANDPYKDFEYNDRRDDGDDRDESLEDQPAASDKDDGDEEIKVPVS